MKELEKEMQVPGVDPQGNCVDVSDLAYPDDFNIVVKVYDDQGTLLTTVTCTDNGEFPFTLDAGVNLNKLSFNVGYEGTGATSVTYLSCTCSTNCVCQFSIPTGKASVSPYKPPQNRHIRVTIVRVIVDPAPITAKD